LPLPKHQHSRALHAAGARYRGYRQDIDPLVSLTERIGSDIVLIGKARKPRSARPPH